MTKFYKDKQQIINWLEKHEVKSYKLVPDEQYGFIVNVNGDIDLGNKKLLSILIKFSKVTGSFNCSDNKLTSLEFSPQTVDGFYCNDNKLASLEFCPQTVGSDFSCSGNQLTSLEFCPQTVSGNFYCNDNKLTSLEFCPQTVGGHFFCSYNRLISLEFSPHTVKGNFYCSDNPKLKEIQKIINFKLIYLEHKKLLATNLSDKLNDDLINDKSKKTTRIKI